MGVPASTLNVKFKLQRMEVVEIGERGLFHPHSYQAAEPYFWVVYYKIDGSTLTFNSKTGKLESPWPDAFQEPGPSPDMVPDSAGHVGKPQPKKHKDPPPPKPTLPHAPYASVYAPATSGKHKNIGMPGDKDKGEYAKYAQVPINPAIGEWSTQLKPIPVVPPVGDVKAILGTMGCAIVLMEEDNTLSSAVAKGAETFKNRISSQLAAQLSSAKLGAEILENINVREAADAGVKTTDDNMSAMDRVLARFDLDDFVGTHVFRHSHTALFLRKTIPFYKKIESDGHGIWELYGEVTASEIK